MSIGSVPEHRSWRRFDMTASPYRLEEKLQFEYFQAYEPTTRYESGYPQYRIKVPK